MTTIGRNEASAEGRGGARGLLRGLACVALVGLPAVALAQQASFDGARQLVAEDAIVASIGMTLDEPVAGFVALPYSLGGSATAGDDFALLSANPIVIGDGGSHADLYLGIVGDATPEGAESILIDLDGPPSWWDAAFAHRLPIAVGAAGHDRVDFVAPVAIDWTARLSELGDPAAMQLDSLRVVEVDATGAVIDTAVPFQFDPDPGYDALSDATGTLMLQLVGATASGAARSYHVYFDTTPGFTPAVVTPQVQFDPSSSDEGQAAYEIVTPNATWYYHTLGGGFSSVIDDDGNDWVGNNPTVGAQGSYRGVPNMSDLGYFHPGLALSLSSVIETGPLRASFESMSPDTLWRVRWDVYPSHARMTVLAADGSYWFLYEGTPGGDFEQLVDFVGRSDGAQIPGQYAWQTELVGEEWVYFADPGVGRSLFLLHEEDDAAVESFWPFGDDMTVYGFGRLGQGQPLTPQLTGVDRHYTLGFVDETAFAATAPLIRGATVPVSIAVGTPEDRDLQPILQHEIVIAEPFAKLHGSGLGGTVELSIGGVDLVVATSPGDTPEMVASAIAAAIVGHPTLAAAGVLATASGAAVLASSPVTALAVTDPGLSLSAVEPVPGLPLPALLALALGIAGAALPPLRDRKAG